MCATVSPSIIESVTHSKMWNLICCSGGGVKKKKHAEKNRSTRFSNCANVGQKNGSQFSGFIYKRCYINLNDSRIKSTSVVSIIPVQTTVHT